MMKEEPETDALLTAIAMVRDPVPEANIAKVPQDLRLSPPQFADSIPP
jgi:hypothetical protein